MRGFRSLLASLLTSIVIAGSAIVGQYVLQNGVDQRIAGLEARVTVLEQEVSVLKTEGTGATPIPETFKIIGTVKLRQDRSQSVDFIESMEYCSGTGGYDDIHTGANVVILDGSGKTMATTSLKFDNNVEHFWYVCHFRFTVEVPQSDFYTLTIGGREAPTYSHSEMEENNWKLDLIIGSPY